MRNAPIVLGLLLLGLSLKAQVAIVRHAPSISGSVEGSVHLLTGENVDLNGGAVITGDLLVPGTPEVVLNGKPGFSGTLDGAGLASPENYRVTLSGGASVRHVVRRTDGVTLADVAAPPLPAGTRAVTISKSDQAVGDFTTLKDLTLNSNVGEVAVPPGTYGDFSANAGSGFALGIAGSTAPAVYHFQNLGLNSNSTFTVIGPVVVTVAAGFSTNANMGAAEHPEWLKLRIAVGGLTLNGNRSVYAHLEAPGGTLTLNGGARFVGLATSDRLIINGNALLRLVIPPVSYRLPFQTGFERDEWFALGPLDGQRGWAASGLSVVTDADAHAGTQSALLLGNTFPLSLSRAFDPHPEQTVVFVDLFTLPQAAADEQSAVRLSALNAAQVAFVRDGNRGLFSVFSGNGAGGGVWQRIPSFIPVDADGFASDWVRLTLRLDYTATEWDLYVGGVMVAAKLGFQQSAPAGLGALTLTSQASTPALLDDVLAAFDNPLFPDADRDGMPDTWETAHGLNPLLNDRNGDPDADGLANIQEYLFGTNPTQADTDGDSLPDKWEITYGTNPNLNNASADDDGDGLSNAQEYALGTNPRLADTDGDGMPDGWEQAHGFNPLLSTDAAADADGDGISNLAEFTAGTDPSDYYNGVLPVTNSLVGPDGELGPDGSLAVWVGRSGGQPLANAPVIFRAKSGGHLLAPSPASPGAAEITVRSDASGIARAYVR